MIDYAKHFKTSSAVYLELKTLAATAEKMGHGNNFIIKLPSKRNRRLIKMFYILKKSEKRKEALK